MAKKLRLDTDENPEANDEPTRQMGSTYKIHMDLYNALWEPYQNPLKGVKNGKQIRHTISQLLQLLDDATDADFTK